jgi:predicted ferric reductase
MRRLVYAVFWIAVYVTLTMAPLFVLLIGPARPGRDFWREFSVALGFAGLAMMGLQFLLTARYRALTSPYGIDVIYHFHRQISLVAFALILAHPLILFVSSPSTLALLNPFTAPLRANLGVAAIVALVLIILISLKRIPLRIPYEPWRLSHGVLATLAVGLAMGHVILVGYYIDTPAKRALWITLGVIWIGALLHIRIIKPVLMLRRPYRVETVTPERGDTYSLALRAEGHRGMKFKPGQFAWLTIHSSPFAIKEHPFSFSSSAMATDRVELAIKELGDFTATVKTIRPGTRAYLDGPYGAFSIDQEVAPGYVFIAGGVGITPVMSMLRTLADRHDRRPLLLMYGSKTWEEVTFREELEELKQRLNLRVVHVIEKAPDDWDGESGFMNAAMLARHLPEDRMEHEFFVCGPVPMMNAVEQGLERLGIPIENVNSERFNLV